PDGTGLFCGSEGLFGIAVEATLRLVPVPGAVRTSLAVYDSLEAAGGAVAQVDGRTRDLDARRRDRRAISDTRRPRSTARGRHARHCPVRAEPEARRAACLLRDLELIGPVAREALLGGQGAVHRLGRTVDGRAEVNGRHGDSSLRVPGIRTGRRAAGGGSEPV